MRKKMTAILLSVVVLVGLVIVAVQPVSENRAAEAFSAGAFWVVSFTWGLPASLAGAVMALVYHARGFEAQRLHRNIYFENVRPVGSNNLGPFFFLGENAMAVTPYHEAGHGLQNIVLGPLYPIVVGIPSEIWYQYFIRKYADELANDWDPEERRIAYDKMPTERWATQWGLRVYWNAQTPFVNE